MSSTINSFEFPSVKCVSGDGGISGPVADAAVCVTLVIV